MHRVALTVGLLALGACASAPKSVRVVPFTLGTPAFSTGDSIDIEEIVGTRPRLEVGGVYLVSGRTRVESHDGARLALYSTGSDDGVRTQGYQTVVVPRGETAFHLAVAVLADGDLHLSLAPTDDTWSNHPFGGIYFRDPDRPFLFGGVQRVSTGPVSPAAASAAGSSPTHELPFDEALTDAERARDEAALVEQYLPHRDRFAQADRGGWIAVAGGRIFPADEQGTPATPASTMEAAVAAAAAAVPHARHRFVFRVGEEGDGTSDVGGCELPHVLGVEFLAWIERPDVEMRAIGPGQKIWYVKDGVRTEITTAGADKRMFLRPEVGPPGAPGRAEALFALSTGYGGGFAVLPSSTAAAASLHLWEIPGTMTMSGVRQSGSCRRARARFRFPGTDLDVTAPVAIWPK